MTLGVHYAGWGDAPAAGWRGSGGAGGAAPPGVGEGAWRCPGPWGRLGRRLSVGRLCSCVYRTSVFVACIVLSWLVCWVFL